MESVFQHKYKISSNRLRGWNYTSDGHYFITIVTANREELFGKIEKCVMIPNDFGRIVCDEFFKSFEIREELYLGEFVLMPNHIHAIITLEQTNCMDTSLSLYVETHGRASLPQHRHASLPQLIRKAKSISSFVAGFKSATIKQIDNWIDVNKIKMAKFNKRNPLWQANYYDHIIRSEKEYMNISGYIVDNPLIWERDRNNRL